jgi:Icc protein
MSPIVSDAVFTVVQISDCHLGEYPGEQLLGMDADQSLNDVLVLIAAEQPQLDLLIVSGDLANHGSELAYQRLQHYLQRPLPVHAAPIFYLPGNHDDLNLLRDSLSVGEFPSRTTLGDWQIIGLNSAVPKQVGGALDDEQLQALEKLLVAHTEPTLLVLHHPPLLINCAWLDPQRVNNGDALLALVSAYPQVKAVLCGHVHQDNRFDYQHLPIYTTPSTCIQFLPRSDEFALDDVNPGYRWLKLFADGRLETGVSRVSGAYVVDHKASGY